MASPRASGQATWTSAGRVAWLPGREIAEVASGYSVVAWRVAIKPREATGFAAARPRFASRPSVRRRRRRGC